MKSTKAIITTSLLSALVGGLVVALLVAVLDVGGTTTTRTVVQQAPLGGASGDATADGAPVALTAKEIYKRDAPGVVFIAADVVQKGQNPLGFGEQQDRKGTATGSGFVIDEDGYILTNAHVVEGATRTTVQFSDKKTASARIVGRDTSTDVALLKVDPKGLDLRPLRLGTGKGISVGDPTVAIGNPFGLDRTLTTGVISALQRRIKAPNGFAIDNVIQTDAAINPGNSGGPLINAAGEVIGINSQIETAGGSGAAGTTGGNVGIGFAVPIQTATRLVPRLKADGSIKRAFLGVTTISARSALKQLKQPLLDGALVQTVAPGSPAAKAGIVAGRVSTAGATLGLAKGGDVIVAVDGDPTKSASAVVTAVSAHKPGETITVTVVRDGHKRDLRVTLADRPDTAIPG